MTESPKITACGLFTVNLQVFYNVTNLSSVEKMTTFHGFFPRFQVFAAIVTYIMILFQFRDFEK